jgi:hypothetical protein
VKENIIKNDYKSIDNIINISYNIIIKNRKTNYREDENMIYRIKVEGKEYNENYTFETPKEGDILDELRAIVEDMEEGNIDKLKIEREA